MSDTRGTLERIGNRVPVPQPAFARLERRRDRKRRDRRIGAGLVASFVAIAAAAVLIRAFGEHPAQVPLAPTSWSAQFPTAGHDGRAPVAADASGIYVLTDTPYDASGIDLVLTRYDARGGETWRREFGTRGENDYARPPFSPTPLGCQCRQMVFELGLALAHAPGETGDGFAWLALGGRCLACDATTLLFDTRCD